MADGSSQLEIRGLDVDKLVKGFADEENILKNFCNVSKTSARQIRWYSKTSGFLDTIDPLGSVAYGGGAKMENTSSKARAVVLEQDWTRTNSYVKKYFVESPIISMEDIKDTDVDIMATNIRDLVRAVQRKVDKRIYDVLTVSDVGTGENTLAITHEWNDPANAVPISDILTAKEYIRNYGYDPEGAVFIMRPDAHRFLLNHLISVKGSSIPQFASKKIEKGVVMEILGLQIFVTTAVTADKAVIFVPKRALTWKTFMPITSVVIDDPGIGKKIRVWEEGEAILTDPRAVTYISNIGP